MCAWEIYRWGCYCKINYSCYKLENDLWRLREWLEAWSCARCMKFRHICASMLLLLGIVLCPLLHAWPLTSGPYARNKPFLSLKRWNCSSFSLWDLIIDVRDRRNLILVGQHSNNICLNQVVSSLCANISMLGIYNLDDVYAGYQRSERADLKLIISLMGCCINVPFKDALPSHLNLTCHVWR